MPTKGAFADLGVEDLVGLYGKDRAETPEREKPRLFDGSAAVFFFGRRLRISIGMASRSVQLDSEWNRFHPPLLIAITES